MAPQLEWLGRWLVGTITQGMKSARGAVLTKVRTGDESVKDGGLAF